MEKGSLSIHSENIFPIIKKWLYSDIDIFVRELVSNSSDAMTKLKKMVSLGEADMEGEPDYRIDITISESAGTITFSDRGIGMTEEEVKKYINQIAFSGAYDFLEKYKDKDEGEQIIGHFGLGFYSAFMVAEKVEIQTLSHQKGAVPVKWLCEGGAEYEMSAGSRQTYGTDIILYVNEDGKKYLNEWAMRETIRKYCSFMPYPIYLKNADAQPEKDENGDIIIKEETPLNTPTPLYLKQPSEVTEEEYKEFYRNTFTDFNEPHFWIHLNMDYPFRLKGILYFPKLKNEFDTMEGQIKLYNSQVFIADNIKEVIPEFLLLLKGIIDCPDLPLNVSRSFLQNDGFVRKLSDYITKKVADKLNSLFKKERTEAYEKFWADIHPFVKYGCLKDDKFFEKVKDILIFKDIDHNYLTLPEYREKAGNDNVYYFTDRNLQASYLAAFVKNGLNAIEMGHTIDQPFLQRLESDDPEHKLHFLRIDSDITAEMKTGESMSEDVKKSLTENLEKIFQKALAKEDLKISVEALKDQQISGMVLLSEEKRRMQDMMKMYGFMGMDLGAAPSEEILLLNKNNRLVTYLLENPNADTDTVSLLCHQIYDLALLSHKPLEAERMTAFLERSNQIMELFLEK
ncbi:molecular chaperone HtpG [Clostridiales bacterium COT073_COT-073]|nr:molecular chaperone HtpG [Clostridiales bacterium COT073_COT-073]